MVSLFFPGSVLELMTHVCMSFSLHPKVISFYEDLRLFKRKRKPLEFISDEDICENFTLFSIMLRG